jgi:hypothetical protein
LAADWLSNRYQAASTFFMFNRVISGGSFKGFPRIRAKNRRRVRRGLLKIKARDILLASIVMPKSTLGNPRIPRCRQV